MALERVVSKDLFRTLAHPRRPARHARARTPDAPRAPRPPALGRARDSLGVRPRRRRQPLVLQLPPASARTLEIRRGGRRRRRPRAALARDRVTHRVRLRRPRVHGAARRAPRAPAATRARRAAPRARAPSALAPRDSDLLGDARAAPDP